MPEPTFPEFATCHPEPEAEAASNQDKIHMALDPPSEERPGMAIFYKLVDGQMQVVGEQVLKALPHA